MAEDPLLIKQLAQAPILFLYKPNQPTHLSCNKMNNSILTLLRYGFSFTLISLLLAFATPAHATHIVGADLTYSCLNAATGLYDVNLRVYRDAINGVTPFDNTITVFIFQSSTGSLFLTRDVLLPPGPADTLPVSVAGCANISTIPNIRVEYKDYNFQVLLPSIPGGYDIGWARCCRNNAITNIANNQGITVTAHVPGSGITGCNSSPVFNQIPPSFLCLNQPFYFDFSATDTDGDSLVYAISNPFGGSNLGGLGVNQANTTVSQFGNQMGAPPYLNLIFSPGYSFTDPFGGGSFQIDPQSGLLCLTPNQVGISVFAVSVLEYRNGVLLSENKRDFQVQVINCNSPASTPVISKDLTTIPATGAGNPGAGQVGNGILAISGDTIYAMPTSNFCYDVSLTDPTASDTVELFAVSSIFGVGGTASPPLASLVTSGINPVTGTICWDVPCQREGETVMLVVGGRDINDCEGYNLVFDTTYVVITQTRPSNISHTTTQGLVDTVDINPLQNFCYSLGAFDLDTFDILEFFPVEGPFNGLGGSGPFATLTSNGTNPMNGQVCWTVPCEAAGQLIRFVIGVQDNNYCFNQSFDTLYVRVGDLPPVGILPAPISCVEDSVTLNALGGTAYSWTPATGLNYPNVSNPRAAPLDTTTYYVTITDSLGCPRMDSITVNVYPIIQADAGNDTTVCRGSTVQLSASGGIFYTWNTSIPGLNIYDIPNPLASPDSQTTYYVTITDVNFCTRTDSIVVTPMYAEAGSDEVICSGDSVQLSGSGGQFYQWTPTGNIINANTANPTVFPTVSTTYYVTVTDTSGCSDIDSMVVLVNPSPNVNFGPSQILCAGDSLQLNATGGVDYTWESSPTLIYPDSANPVVFPVVPTTYYLTILDSIGCTNRDSVEISLHPLAMPDPGMDTVKCGNIPVQLMANSAVQYIWTPSISLSDTAIANPIADPLVNTTYYLSIVDTNGCRGTDSVFVRVWEANAGPDLDVCFGDSIALQAQDGVAYNWDASPFLSNTNTASPLAFPTDTTEFYVTITDSSTCTDRDTVQVNVLPPPTLVFNPTNPQICSGDSLNLGASGGNTYAWSPASLLSDPNISNPQTQLFYTGVAIDTTYEFSLVIEDNGGCRNTDTLDVTVRRLPLIGLPSDTTRCPNDSIGLNVLEGNTFTWTPNLAISDTSLASVFVSPDSSTTYQVVASDVAGCTDSAQVFVQVNQLSAGPDQGICLNDSVQIEALGGESFSWSPSTGLNNPTIRNPMASPAVTTTYEVIMIDSAGCPHVDSVTVTVTPLPVVSAGDDRNLCFGDSLQLNGGGGTSFQWSPATGLSNPAISNPMASPSSTTTYFMTATAASGCSNIDSVIITVNQLPTADAGPDRQIKCGLDSLQLNATGGIFYQWAPATDINNPNIANPLVAPDSSQTYVVTVIDSNSCVSTDTVEVLSFYVTTNGDQEICPSETVNLTANAINGQLVSFDWQPDSSLLNPGMQTVQANPLSSTNYFLIATDSSGCIDTASAFVTVRVGPLADAGRDTSICIGEDVQLNGNGGFTYLWSPTSSLDNPAIPNPIASPLLTTTYYLEVSDTSSCTGRDSVVITVNQLPMIEAGLPQTKCGEQSVQLAASGGLSYVWTPALALSNDSISDPLANPDSTTTYTVSGMDSNGCVNTDSVVVSTFYAQAGPDQQICPGVISQMSASHIGGLATSYAWEPFALVGSPEDPNTLFSVTQDTLFIVTITDSSGCSDQDSVRISVFPEPMVDAGTDQALCIGSRVDLLGNGGVTYTWSPATDLSNPNIANPTAGPQTTTTYVMTAIDTNGCPGVDSLTLTVNPLPILTPTADTLICEGSVAFLSVSGALSYSWSPDQSLGSPTSAQTTAFPDITTTYTVMGTDSNNCSNQADVTVSVEEAPTLTGEPLDSLCVGTTTSLTVSGAQGYLWSNGAQTSSINVSPANSTQYWVLPVNPLGCPGDTFFIDVYVERNLPRAAFEADPTEGPYPLPVNFSNESQFANTFTWYFGDGNISNEVSPTYTYGEPGSYEVRLVADNGLGCPDETSFQFIIALDAQLVLPKAFTPNGDGINDEFSIYSNSFENFNFQVFNRWGRLVYESNNPGFGWDGTFNGEQVPEGVYVFKFRGRTFRGEDVDRAGTITLMR